MNECFVCLQTHEPFEFNICDCKNRFVHKECQKKMLQYLKNPTKCPVCMSVYKNVIVTKKFRITSLGYAVIGCSIHLPIIYFVRKYINNTKKLTHTRKIWNMNNECVVWYCSERETLRQENMNMEAELRMLRAEKQLQDASKDFE